MREGRGGETGRHFKEGVRRGKMGERSRREEEEGRKEVEDK